MWTTALGMVLLVAGLEYSSACSCMEMHIQTHFCRSDYVMQVSLRKKGQNVYSKVKNTDPYEPRKKWRKELTAIKYHVDIRRIFKVKENEAGLRENSTAAVIYTPPNDGLCAVYLDMRTKYLIGGRFNGPKVTLNLCSLVKPWPHVSKRQKKNLLAIYEENCHCQIENWFEELDTPEKCKWHSNKQRHCFERSSACIANTNSLTVGCKWHRNKHNRACKLASRKPQLP